MLRMCYDHAEIVHKCCWDFVDIILVEGVSIVVDVAFVGGACAIDIVIFIDVVVNVVIYTFNIVVDFVGVCIIDIVFVLLDIFVDVVVDGVVNVVVNVAEISMWLWEYWSFEKAWHTEWLSEWKSDY